MEATKRTAFEDQKDASRLLRGTISLELIDPADHFTETNKGLLKFHGTYQQEDRDARKNRSRSGIGKHHMFMVRCRIPGGRLNADQYLAIDELAGTFANGTLRFTSRQGIQLHGVLKGDLKATIAGINQTLLTTLGACGDVVRNVMVSPAPHYQSGVHQQLQELAASLAEQLTPRTQAYHEIWLDGKAVGREQWAVSSGQWAVGSEGKGDQSPSADEEPLYGKTYLPRKFKLGIALPDDNCIDVYAQDLGLLADVENGVIVGFNVLVGGGMGMTHGNANTFPHLAKPVCYVSAAKAVELAEAVVRLFRDHGNRGDRKRARIKYLIHDWGVDKFREVLAGYVATPLIDPKPINVTGFQTLLGWHPQGEERWWFGLSVENGRVKDEGNLQLRTGLREIVRRLRPELRITPLQDVLLCNLPTDSKAELNQILADHGIARPDQISNVRKHSMACPAIPTCGLAISESERALPGIIRELEGELARLGLAEEKLTVRMTGCPNGCARPYQSDIGIVGRSGDKYSVFVGGNILGTRLNFMLRDLVPIRQIVPLLVPLFGCFRASRRGKESFGDWCHRLGAERLQVLLPEPGDNQILTAHPARQKSA